MTTPTQANTTQTHTPGPWKWAPRYREDGNMIALMLETEHRPIEWNDPVIFALREDWIDHVSRNRGPDASLIAAAPDLLDALETMLSAYSAWQMGKLGGDDKHAMTAAINQMNDADQQARDAIQKATGR